MTMEIRDLMAMKPAFPGKVRRKKIVLVVCDYYLPGLRAGGPIRSIAGIAENLAENHHFRIITRGRDHGVRVPYNSVPSGRWTRLSGATIFYTRHLFHLVGSLLQQLRRRHDVDVLYLNSFFSPQFTILPLMLRYFGLFSRPDVRTVIAPRGEFSPGALDIKWLKKRLYLFVIRKTSVLEGVVWHASTEIERDHIIRTIGSRLASKVYVAIAPDLAPQENPVNLSEHVTKKPGELRIVFISRVSRKKNLNYALERLHGLRGKVVFDIYGPTSEPGYLRQCEKARAALPENVVATFRGQISPQDVPRTFARYHLFLLPTLGENYGHVIKEALSSGCPPLLSDNTPWNDIEDVGAGWIRRLEGPESFTEVLQHCIDMDEPEWLDRSQAAQDYIRRHASPASDIEAMENVFGRQATAQ